MTRGPVLFSKIKHFVLQIGARCTLGPRLAGSERFDQGQLDSSADAHNSVHSRIGAHENTALRRLDTHHVARGVPRSVLQVTTHSIERATRALRMGRCEPSRSRPLAVEGLQAMDGAAGDA